MQTDDTNLTFEPTTKPLPAAQWLLAGERALPTALTMICTENDNPMANGVEANIIMENPGKRDRSAVIELDSAEDELEASYHSLINTDAHCDAHTAQTEEKGEKGVHILKGAFECLIYSPSV